MSRSLNNAHAGRTTAQRQRTFADRGQLAAVRHDELARLDLMHAEAWAVPRSCEVRGPAAAPPARRRRRTHRRCTRWRSRRGGRFARPQTAALASASQSSLHATRPVNNGAGRLDRAAAAASRTDGTLRDYAGRQPQRYLRVLLRVVLACAAQGSSREGSPACQRRAPLGTPAAVPFSTDHLPCRGALVMQSACRADAAEARVP